MSKNTKGGSVVWYCFLMAIILSSIFWLLTPFIVGFMLTKYPIARCDLEYYAMFGDLFGSINALFTALAFAGLIVTIIIQQKEYRANTDQLKQAASSIEKQVGLMKKSARLADIPNRIASCRMALTALDTFQDDKEIDKLIYLKTYRENALKKLETPDTGDTEARKQIYKEISEIWNARDEISSELIT
ncbi:MAG: hypothetical protein AAF984_08355 [Verrucomicrobiota bacterium]